jgi:hypothetical protein
MALSDFRAPNQPPPPPEKENAEWIVIVMKPLIWTTLAALLAIAAGGAGVAYRSALIDSTFREAHNGEFQSLVVGRLGKPWRESPCGKEFGGTFPSDCSKEMIYRHPLAPAVPQYWSFMYDNRGTLLGTYHYVSP